MSQCMLISTISTYAQETAPNYCHSATRGCQPPLGSNQGSVECLDGVLTYFVTGQRAHTPVIDKVRVSRLLVASSRQFSLVQLCFIKLRSFLVHGPLAPRSAAKHIST